MTGIFRAAIFGVLLWGFILGWLISPWLSIACAAAIILILAHFLSGTREYL